MSNDPYNLIPILKQVYARPQKEGIWIAFHKDVYGNQECIYCPSGNNLAGIIEANPERYITDPIFLPMTNKQYTDVMSQWNFEVENF
jgi:hypothetical protein